MKCTFKMLLKLSRPSPSTHRVLLNPPIASLVLTLHTDHMRQHVDGAEDGEFRDIRASGVCDGALWERVVGDR
jgi:hypothetical protein